MWMPVIWRKLHVFNCICCGWGPKGASDCESQKKKRKKKNDKIKESQTEMTISDFHKAKLIV